jgi:hypothetical protein
MRGRQRLFQDLAFDPVVNCWGLGDSPGWPYGAFSTSPLA